MAGEGDQTRWIGIRPTNPAENIPVTEATPLTQIKVEPLAVGTEFKTLTKKRSPAISDLQAISAIVSDYYTGDVAANRFDITFDSVPAGKLWIIVAIAATCGAAWTSANIFMNSDAEVHYLASPNIANLTAYWNGVYYIEEGEHIHMENRGAVNGNTYHCSMRGYQVDLY